MQMQMQLVAVYVMGDGNCVSGSTRENKCRDCTFDQGLSEPRIHAFIVWPR